jgi:hypothetical protein
MHIKITPYPVINTPREDKATKRQSRYEKWKQSRKNKPCKGWFCCWGVHKKDPIVSEPLYIP